MALKGTRNPRLQEVRAWAPHGRPTYAEWDDALDAGRLPHPGRAQGNCTVLYVDGRPSQIGHWGVTADWIRSQGEESSRDAAESARTVEKACVVAGLPCAPANR